MRKIASVAVILLPIVSAWLVTDRPLLASGDQPAETASATVGTWVNIGPAPLSYAHNPADPENFNSGRVAAIAVDPSNPNHWLIGVGNGGVWESLDGGTSWLPIADSAPTLAIGSIAFAPSDPATIYVGTGESAGVGFTKTGVGVLKSTDSGRSWAVLGTANFARAAVRRMRVHPTNSTVAIAATTRAGFGKDSQENVPASPHFGIQKSVDGGVSWVRTLTGHATALEIDSTNFNNQYAAIGDQRGTLSNEQPGSVINGLYRSANGGDSWSRVDGPWGTATPPNAVGRIELALSPSAPNVLYASIQNPQNTGALNSLYGLFRTDNAWASVPTWVRVPTDLAGVGGYCGPGKCGYSHVITVDPANPNTVFAGGAERGFWRCTNCGASPTWTNATAGSPVHPDHHALAWAGNRLIDGNDGGIWSTSNGGTTWQNHNSGLSTAMFFSAALHPTDRQFMIGGIRDFAPSVAGPGNRWSINTLVAPTWEWGEAEVAMSSSAPSTHWMLAWLRGAIQRTTDGGTTGIQADAGIDKTGAAFVAPVRKCPTNDDVFLTGTNRMWRTNNFFSAASPSWAANGPPHPFPYPTELGAPGTIHAIAFAASEGGCATYAYGNRGGEIYLTRNGGVSWTDLDPASALPARPINSIVFDPTTAAVAYAALSSFDNGTPGMPGHVFKSTDALAATPTWIDISPAADVPFNVLAIDPRTPNLIYAGSDAGLWRSSDGGATWSKQGLNVGMPNVPVYDIQINPTTDTTIAFTYGRGAYRLVTAATAVQPPSNLRVQSVVGSTVTVSFTPPEEGLTPTGYVLEGGATPGQVLAGFPIDPANSTVTFSAPTGAFYIRVHTVAGGLRSLASNEVRLFVNVTAAPAPVTNLLSLVDGNTVSLAWMNGASGGALTELHIVVQGALNTFVPIAVTENITVGNVPAGTYSLWVHGVSRAGDGPNSNGVIVAVPGPCTGIPGAPLNLTATRAANVISLAWDLPVSGPAPAGFAVNVTGAFAGSFPIVTRRISGAVGPGSYTVTVTSSNSCGTSAPSPPVTVVVP